MRWPDRPIGWLFDPRRGPADRSIPRWCFLRGLGAIYFSAFFSLLFQIKGLIGPMGILPARAYLQAVANSLGPWQRVWYAPTLLWWWNSDAALITLCWVGMAAALLVILNLWPRGMLAICFLLFLSFVAGAQDFSGYQSDGMLLEAGFLSLFFAPWGWRPGFARSHPASRASMFLLLWEWFRIYFESGIVKLQSGDPEWRHFTAMDEYYQNGPLPTWIGWYVQHMPHWFHAATVFATLGLELVLVWMMFLPRRWRIVCFLIVTPWQIGVILTANYTFLNYLVLLLGVLLLDDRFVVGILPARWRARWGTQSSSNKESDMPARSRWQRLRPVRLLVFSVWPLIWIFYATTAEMFLSWPLPTAPVIALEPFRIANRYGLFAVMTRGRYEIEFQGSSDGEHWVEYPFRFKPQKLNQAPGIYAPYQPRFDWNLWFASLGMWRDYAIVPTTEVRLLDNNPEVLSLFADNPFRDAPPKQIRVLLWQYWFTSMAEKRATGMWWRRQLLGLYAPTIERSANGEIKVVEWPTVGPRE